MRSIIDSPDSENTNAIVEVPPEFDNMARKFIRKLRSELSANEIRAMAADKVACPNLSVSHSEFDIITNPH